MLKKVQSADRALFQKASLWLDAPTQGALIFTQTKNTWAQLSTYFKNDFRIMLYDNNLPSDQEVIAMFDQLRTALSEK